MTLPSLKNLRITRLSRQVWITSLSLAGFAAVSCGIVQAQRPGQRYMLTIENNQPRIQLIEGVQNPDGSSLERLKERSAQERFEELQRKQESAPAPAAEPLPLLEPDESEPIPIVPPAPVAVPVENKLPRLPDLDELEEFDPFIESQKQLHAVQPQAPPKRIVRPVPAPAPVAVPQLTEPVYSTFQAEEGDELRPLTPPDVVRSLSEIQPTYDWQFKVKDDYAGKARTEEPDRVPSEEMFPQGAYQERISPDSLFAWEASNLFHYPLYFSDPPLERYGHVHPHIQPFISLSRIGVQLLGLPYQTVIDTPTTHQYILGWYRPGDPAPHLCYQVPLNPEAAAAETLGIATGFLIIP